MIKKSVHKKDITISLNLSEHSFRVHETRISRTEQETDRATVTIIDLNTLLSIIDRTIRGEFQKIIDLNNTVNK